MMTDKTLRQHVLDELAWDARLDATHIAMTAVDGTVTLSGHVPTYAQLFAAAHAVHRVQGVKAVANELRVELAASDRRDDKAIATSVAHVLDSNLSPTEQSVRAEVRNGVVVLDGSADWQHQREHVGAACWLAPGVRKVTDRIAVG